MLIGVFRIELIPHLIIYIHVYAYKIVIFPLDVAGAVKLNVTLSFPEASVCVTASF